MLRRYGGSGGCHGSGGATLVVMDGPTVEPQRQYHSLTLVRSPNNVLMPPGLPEAAARHGTHLEVCKAERPLLSQLISTRAPVRRGVGGTAPG